MSGVAKKETATSGSVSSTQGLYQTTRALCYPDYHDGDFPR